jgi:DNA-directed RNA polymerase subunit H (RpoH/RPB5)
MAAHNVNNEVQRSFGIIAEMLRDRGEDVSSLSSVSAEDVVAVAGGRTVFHLDLPSCGVRVIYNLNQRFKLASIRKLLDDDSPRVFIVVCKDRPVASAIKGVAELNKDIQLFDLRELQFNVSQHVLQPQFEPVREDAAINEIVKRYDLESRYRLPLILSTDPMARYLALKPGQLVRIIRPSPSAGSYVTYRCCQRAA